MCGVRFAFAPLNLRTFTRACPASAGKAACYPCRGAFSERGHVSNRLHLRFFLPAFRPADGAPPLRRGARSFRLSSYGYRSRFASLSPLIPKSGGRTLSAATGSPPGCAWLAQFFCYCPSFPPSSFLRKETSGNSGLITKKYKKKFLKNFFFMRTTWA